MSDDLMIKISHVSKEYRLGAIGGTTLREDLARLGAKLRHKEDPTLKIGQTNEDYGKRFLALNDVSFEVHKGEAVGVIGHNGAGKSTLLKLLSRVTAPSSGTIGLNGRIASMLEVGTGFHPELTGRENIYMNGAILGMTKAEIDKKIDEIIDFSECRRFIDTPVKRYSSGMYVKLAFSVAAHLDSEIMVMDEVLAVGDMKFQQKCLGRMGEAADHEGKTILYVSHNMSTIRQLCTRCVVLDHGKLIFDGDVEEAIAIYQSVQAFDYSTDIDLSEKRMAHLPVDVKAKMTHFHLLSDESPMVSTLHPMIFELTVKSYIDISTPLFRFEIKDMANMPIGTCECDPFDSIRAGEEKTYRLSLNISNLVKGQYRCLFVLYSENEYGAYDDYDAIMPAFVFEVIEDNTTISWNPYHLGKISFPRIHRI